MSDAQPLADADFARLADFRFALRKFLDFSARAAAEEGMTPQQHQALLVIRGSPGAVASVGRLAERLCIRHNTAVELAQRLEHGGYITRHPSEVDRRSVMLTLTTAGDAKLEVLSQAHRRELRQTEEGWRALVQNLDLEDV